MTAHMMQPDPLSEDEAIAMIDTFVDRLRWLKAHIQTHEITGLPPALETSPHTSRTYNAILMDIDQIDADIADMQAVVERISRRAA